MDYIKQNIFFKIKKVLRYIRLYGLSRTYIKVQGQYHMKKEYEVFPGKKSTLSKKQNIGIIGCGNYAFSNIAYYLKKSKGRVIAATMDKNLRRAASLSQAYKAPFYTDNAEELINIDQLKLIYIASNHASHAEYAIKAMQKGKDVYIEKPHVVSEEQLERLIGTMKDTKRRVFLGFNRPQSRFAKIIEEHIKREDGPAMYNWFVAGHQIAPDHWYFNAGEGGRVLGNLCHWSDFVLRLVPDCEAYPITITAVSHIKEDSDIAVSYKFNDGTIATITFSEKGYAFEGVREKFNAHKGNCLIEMSDFQRLTIDVGDQKKIYHNFYRDQGHKVNILRAYNSVQNEEDYDFDTNLRYVENTAMIFLKTKEALEKRKTVQIDGL